MKCVKKGHKGVTLSWYGIGGRGMGEMEIVEEQTPITYIF
jgi:hypothetical protein